MIIAVDFDGTIVTHEFPEIGRKIGAFKWLRLAQKLGAKIILFTMRSGKHLQDAVEYVESNGINLYGVNTNPTQHKWTTSPKAYAQLYIDDASLGIPLTTDSKTERPYVDWNLTGPQLMNYIKNV